MAPATPLLIGSGDAITGLRQSIGRVADTDAAVIQEKPAPGKELVARLIHVHSRQSFQTIRRPQLRGFVPESGRRANYLVTSLGAFTGAVRRRAGDSRQQTAGRSSR